MEKRKRRASGLVVARGSVPSRIRHLKVDSDPIWRGVAISRHLALSLAPSAGETRMDRGPVGGKSRAAPASILQANSARQEGAGLEAAELARFRGCHQPHHRN